MPINKNDINRKTIWLGLATWTI